jgi:LysM repeat protein
MKKITLLFALVLALTLILTACNLPASQPPAQTAAPSRPTPAATNQTLHEIVSSTQTAIAKAGGAAPTQALPTLQNTLSSAENTATPTAAAVNVTLQPTSNVVVPTQAPAITVPTPTPGLPTTYMIHQGEWCFCIARRFNILASALLQANQACQNNSVAPGTNLTIPQNAPAWEGERSLVTHPATYTVRANDTIFTIACYYGAVDPNAIIFANNLTAPYTLVPGQILNIP